MSCSHSIPGNHLLQLCTLPPSIQSLTPLAYYQIYLSLPAFQQIGTVTVLIHCCLECSVTLSSIFHNKIADELVTKHHLCYNVLEFKTNFISFFMI